MLKPLVSPELKRQSYVELLGAFLGYFEALEPALRSPLMSFAEHEDAYRYLPRSALLQDDLIDLDAFEVLERARLTPARTLPNISTADRVLGSLYVLEGATQGGRIIAPRLARALKLTDFFGARYFNLFAWQQWQAFRDLVNSRESRYDPEGVAEGARDTFITLAAHLSDHLDNSTEVKNAGH